MLTIANKGGYMVKKCQKPVYVICEGSLKEKKTRTATVPWPRTNNEFFELSRKNIPITKRKVFQQEEGKYSN